MKSLSEQALKFAKLSREYVEEAREDAKLALMCAKREEARWYAKEARKFVGLARKYEWNGTVI